MIIQNRISKYLLYAIGEILLVVLGILIALQINNTNQERIESRQLWGYLSNIKSNIEKDLLSANDYTFVLDQLSNNTNQFWEIRRKEEFTFRDYRRTQDHLNTIFSLKSFDPNTTGFESLKSTGYIGKLQGTDMEKLLFSYYQVAELISYSTAKKSGLIEDLLKEILRTDWGISAETMFKIELDSTIFTDIRDNYQIMLFSPPYESIVSNTVVNEYVGIMMQFNFLGTSILRMIENNTLDASSRIMRSLELFKSDFSDIGLEEVIINGIVPRSVGVLTNSNLGFDKVKVKVNEDYLEINVRPNLEWAAAMFVVDSLGRSSRASKDFSDFDRIQLELKGDSSGQSVEIALKDKSDPDDGSESRVSINLTNEWKFYEFELSDKFKTADLSKLHMLAGFIVENNTEMFRFYIRNIKFVQNSNEQ